MLGDRTANLEGVYLFYDKTKKEWIRSRKTEMIFEQRHKEHVRLSKVKKRVE